MGELSDAQEFNHVMRSIEVTYKVNFRVSDDVFEEAYKHSKTDADILKSVKDDFLEFTVWVPEEYVISTECNAIFSEGNQNEST